MPPIDDELLENAMAARGHLDLRLADAAAARTAFEDSIRALHRAGGSMREIGKALGISHQRVAQVVAAAGGPTAATVPPVMNCHFCLRSQHDVNKLVAGPGIYICDACIEEQLERSLVVPEGHGRKPCRFCGKRPGQVAAVVGVGKAQICAECLALAEGIIDQADAEA